MRRHMRNTFLLKYEIIEEMEVITLKQKIRSPDKRRIRYAKRIPQKTSYLFIFSIKFYHILRDLKRRFLYGYEIIKDSGAS